MDNEIVLKELEEFLLECKQRWQKLKAVTKEQLADGEGEAEYFINWLSEQEFDYFFEK